MLKYPRTPHLPWSQGATDDDKVLSSLDFLMDRELVTTEKMDGGCFTMTRDGCYARSPSAVSQPWDSPARAEWARIAHDIPEGYRLVGESMHARRSVAYDGLPGPFLVFAMFDPHGLLESWASVEAWAELFELPTVPVLRVGRGLVAAHDAWAEHRSPESSEGYVVRTALPISAERFNLKVAKYVRATHVQTSDDWRRRDDYETNGYK